MLNKKITSVILALAIAFTVAAAPSGTFGNGITDGTVYADEEAGWSYGIEEFVRGLYIGCLGREADYDGLSYWCSMLASGEATGKEAAQGFFYSREFLLSLPFMTEEDVINRFYNVFLGRAADADGLNYWAEMLRNGGGPDELFAGFADSQEFLARCESCGVEAGPHINVADVQSYWSTYSTGFNLMRLRRGHPIDEEAVITSIIEQCSYWARLEYSNSPDALYYVLGGKSLQPGGGIDCSGFVTAIYRRALGTQTFGFSSVYDSTLYVQSQDYMGPWYSGPDRPAPVNEGVYSTVGDSNRPIYVDRYGIATAYAMNTFQWHHYFNYLGMNGNSCLTWRISDYTPEQVTEMLNIRGFKVGDIIIWYSSSVDAVHSEHIGIYAGDGNVWHCTSMLEDGVLLTPVAFIGNYEDSVLQYCRIYHMT